MDGGSTVILLPKSARGFYIHADGAARTYQAELGITLPSGEFHPLASSNTVRTPRVGKSEDPARDRVRFDAEGHHVAEAALALAPAAPPRGAWPTPGWRRKAPLAARRPGSGARPGGASDTYRR